MSTLTKNINNTTDTHTINFLTQKGFQLLYLEYYAYLRDSDNNEISRLYQEGLQYNLGNTHYNADVLQYVEKDITQYAEKIVIQKNICKKDLQEYITKESSGLLEALSQYLDQRASGVTDPNNQRVNELKQQFISHLAIHPTDSLTEFNLAWLYYHLLEDYQAANIHFGHVIVHHLLDDTPFTQLALRYQSMTFHLLGDDCYATTTLQRAASLDKTNNFYYLYEIAQHLIQSEEKEVALSHLKALIKHSPLFYVHIQSDPFFSDIPEVDQLLTRFHSAKLESIKEMTYRKWQNCPLMQQDLPQEFDHQKLFTTNFEEHLPLLTHQPYPLLCRTDKISSMVLKNLKNKTKVALNLIKTNFTQRIESEQKKWRTVNLLGVSLVYIAVLLTLASIFLFIGSDLLGLTAKGDIISWEHLIPRLFASVLGTGVVGVLLLQFNPPKLKKLAKKRSMLVETIS